MRTLSNFRLVYGHIYHELFVDLVLHSNWHVLGIVVNEPDRDKKATLLSKRLRNLHDHYALPKFVDPRARTLKGLAHSSMRR